MIAEIGWRQVVCMGSGQNADGSSSSPEGAGYSSGKRAHLPDDRPGFQPLFVFAWFPSSLSGLEKQLRRNRITHCFCSRPINEAIPDPVVCRFFGVF
ncbi:MAG: hypothetical protein ACOYD3_06695, partial [Kiritimatiellia bacterium]